MPLSVKSSKPPLVNLVETGERAILAMRVLVHPNISLANAHISGVEDLANARAEMIESMFS